MHEAKPSAVLESRLCLKCNKSRTCTSVNGALTGVQCRILSRLKKLAHCSYNAHAHPLGLQGSAQKYPPR